MSRPRTPTTVLKLRGAFKNHPEREKERENEPEVTEPLGAAPDKLDESQTARWNEIATWCPWLTVADRVLVELVCRLWTASRNNTASPADYKTLLSALAHLGMTPVDRSKVKVSAKKTPKNKFRELA